MKTVTFKLPKLKDVEFIIECLEEDIPIKGNASAIDEKTDNEIYQSIIKQLEEGNEWAWCCVKVKATYKGITGTDYLGGCSYKSKEDFMKCAYYKDMKNAAFADLITQLKAMNDE